MSEEYPDILNLFGYDESDPLGLEEYKKKREEENKIRFGNLPFEGIFGVKEPGPLPTGEIGGQHPEAAFLPAEEPSFLDRAKDFVSSLLGQDPDEVASREAAQTIARREQMAKEQKQFEEDVKTHGLLSARIPGANPEVGTPLDAMAGLLMSMPGGMGRGSFESRNIIGEMRGERADFLKGERTKPIPSEPVEDLTAAMELTPQEQMRNNITGVLASGKTTLGVTPPESSVNTAQAMIRLDALLNELAPTLGPHAAEILNAPELKGLGFQYLPGVAGRYGEKGKIFYDPVELASRLNKGESLGDIMKYFIEHELSHAEKPELPGDQIVGHALPTSNKEHNRVGGIEGELFGQEGAIPAIIEGETRIGLPAEAWEHTREGGEIRSSVDALENIFTGRRNILEHDPYTQHLLGQLRDNIKEAGLYEALTGRKPTETETVTEGPVHSPELEAALKNLGQEGDITTGMEEGPATAKVFPEAARRKIELLKKQLGLAERKGDEQGATEIRASIAETQDALAKVEAEAVAPAGKTEAQLKAEADIAAHDKAIADFKAKKAAEAGKPKPTAEELIEMAKKHAIEHPVEPAKNQAEVDKIHEAQVTEPTPVPTKATEPAPRLVPKKVSEKVEETPETEGVVSTPANILRKLLTETKMTKFNVHTIKNAFKEKGIELPAEVEAKIPDLVKELKDRGWLQEKLGGTYTLLAAPPKTLRAITGAKPLDTTNIKESLEKTIEAAGGKVEEVPSEQVVDTTPTPGLAPKVKAAEQNTMSKLSDSALERLSKSLPEGSQGRKDVEAEIARRAETTTEAPVETKEETTTEEAAPTEEPTKNVPVGKVPNLTETMKAKLTPEEMQAIGKLFGVTTTPKKGTKEVPEEVRLAQQAAIKGVAEKETKKAETEGKPPTPEEPSGEVAGGESEGKSKPFEVTLNDGTTHIVRAKSAEEAQFKAEQVLDEYGSSKTVDKVEPHLTTLEKAAKYEIEPVKTGSEAVSEELKETKKSASEEVKETARLGRQEEQLRKAQTKEKFAKKSYNVALSNGRTVVVKARNEKVAREIAEREIRKKGTGVTVESVGLKPSALEAAITGGARKLEESGFLQSPIVKLLNSVKSVAFGGDVGHLLRQGKQMNADLLFSKHAGKVLEQFPVIFKSAKSQEFFDKFNENLYADPLIKKMVDDFGLDMPGMGAHYKEEAFHGAGLVEEAPIIGKYFAKPSERAYTSGLNFLRAAQVRKWAETLKKDGFTPENAPEKYHAMARAVNIISQRGHFQPAYQKLFSDASAVYGAPRAKAARLQNAFELFRGGTSGRVVRMSAAKTLAFNAGLFGLLKATLGATFVTDSESSDFGKIRIKKNITVDPWVGLGVTARTVAKLVHGKTKSPYTGKRYPTTPSDALMGEFLGGVAPGVKLAWEAMSGTDLRGYQVDRLGSLLNAAPLTARSIAELLQSGDIDDAILLSILQAGGEGVDVFNYEQERAKQKRLKQERGIGSSSSRPTFNY